ncbi:telomeric repeat-binding factor 1 [Puntigrus tetrazona]|uniref:telomeric repeat-binding factor 1 n=1 Tax=Puntigrus tetrazona TaxID=1606681 RepID=UPI001C8A3601|nr:telomeric repeat-binding factor 1 [Puntigrus tetrazona]
MASSSDIISSTTDKINLSEVEGVVQSWIIDYYFASLCRLFRDRSVLEFRKTLKLFESIVDDLESSSHGSDHSTQRTICCFLARVMDGENLEVHYDHVSQITPLMSALPIWETLKDVSESDLHAKIKTLLIVQSVAVCVRKGHSKTANKTLQWLEKETELPAKLQGKLATIVSKKDAYDQLLMNFTLEQLLENIDTFLIAFSQERSSVFLFEAALKVVQARYGRSEKTSSEQEESEMTPSSTESNKPEENEEQVDPLVLNIRPKKKLFSKQIRDVWKPETAKKKQTTHRRTSIFKISRRSSVCSDLRSNVTMTSQPRRRWNAEEDKKLKAGVKKFGEGRWTMILNEFDFENRTGVNLKDRWRTLKKMEGY